MKLFKRIMPLILVIVCIFTVASCKKNSSSSYKYPSSVPLYTNEESFVKIGNLDISKKDVYNRLLNSYGEEVLGYLLDTKLLTEPLTAEEENEFQDYLADLKGNSTDEEFKNSCLSAGLKVDDADKDSIWYYETYYRLVYKRQVKAIKVLGEEIAAKDKKAEEDGTDKYFADSAYVAYFNNHFHKHYDLVVVTFTSEMDALTALKDANVNTAKLTGEWEDNAGTKLTKDQIKAAFLAMYNAAYGVAGEVKTYTYEELSKLATSSSQDYNIANKVVKLSTDELTNSYTHGPLTYGSRYYLVYEDAATDDYFLDSNEEVKLDKDAVTKVNADGVVTEISDAAKEVLYDYLVENELTGNTTNYSSIINRILYKVRQDAGLEIFAEGLEISYKTSYESAFSTLGITDYDAFKETTNVSSNVVAKLSDYEITVEDMYKALTDKYGALVTLLFLQQYTILGSSFNKVLNYETGEILDQTQYDVYVNNDFTTYKEAFESGNFEANGYPAAYGWENFLRDYLGVTNEYQIITDFNSSLYNDVLDLYTKAIYMAEVKDVEVSVPEGASEWYLTSAKWQDKYSTGVEVDSVKDGTTPELSIAYKLDDIADVEKKKTDEGTDIEWKTEDYYGHFILRYSDNEGKAHAVILEVTVDQAVLEKYEEIYKESFSLSAYGLLVNVDADLDGVNDDIEEKDTDDDETKGAKASLRAKAKELVNTLWDLAYDRFDKEVALKTYPRHTVNEYLSDVVRLYATSDTFKEFKQAGFKVSVSSSTTYTRTSSYSEEFLTTAKAIWKDIQDVSSSVMGQTIDPIYRWIENDVVNSIKAMTIADGYEAVFNNNGYYRLVATKATSITAETYTSASNTQKPNYYLYTQYLLDTDKRDVTVYCSSQFTSYYTPAMSALASTNIVNKKILENSLSLLNSVSFSSNNDT